jgi:hypothetical protein
MLVEDDHSIQEVESFLKFLEILYLDYGKNFIMD